MSRSLDSHDFEAPFTEMLWNLDVIKADNTAEAKFCLSELHEIEKELIAKIKKAVNDTKDSIHGASDKILAEV